MIKWKVSFKEEPNKHQNIMEKLLPLELMQLKSTDLGKQFTIKPGNDEYTSRELIFKFYENANCKILRLTGDYPVASIIDLLTELPPVFIFHADLSLTDERITDLNVINAIYAVTPFCNKIIEPDLQFYWRN